MSGVKVRIGMCFMLLAGALALPQAKAADEPTATTLLFSTPYLTSLDTKDILVYEFKRETVDESRYGQKLNDTIRLEIQPNKADSAKRTAMLHIYTGPRQRDLGPFVNATGNPAVMIVLEQDTYELQRHVGGQPAYFRNKIRAAMRDAARVEKTSFEFAGKTIDGHKIIIEPFKDDPNMSRVPEFASTVYEFVVADAVPGGIYRVSSIIHDANNTDRPLKQQDMIFSARKVAQ